MLLERAIVSKGPIQSNVVARFFVRFFCDAKTDSG